jgi:hypothetical protein
MPSELRSVHPVVAALQNDRGRLVMPGSLRQRCLLYLHGLTREAVRRGYVVREQPVALHYRGKITTYGRPAQPDYSRREGELDLVVDGADAVSFRGARFADAGDFARVQFVDDAAFDEARFADPVVFDRGEFGG